MTYVGIVCGILMFSLYVWYVPFPLMTSYQQDAKMVKVMYLSLAEKMLDKFVKENKMIAEFHLNIMATGKY